METSEETINRVVSAYELGAKLRHLRLRKKIGLVDLGKHTGLSASMLSQLETGRLIPTLPTLTRIALVFDVGLDYFFAGPKSRRVFSVVRREERIQFPERAGVLNPSYFFECLSFPTQDKGLEAYQAEFPKRPKGDVPLHFHEGSEFLHVLEGSLSVRFMEEDHLLRAGDSVHFDSAEPHGYRGVSKKPAQALVVTTPPRM
jgi:transcriptional regulator with XRE-family HTH domain